MTHVVQHDVRIYWHLYIIAGVSRSDIDFVNEKSLMLLFGAFYMLYCRCVGVSTNSAAAICLPGIKRKIKCEQVNLRFRVKFQ